jgi:ParB/RepB/Spo0J family partition protein
LAENAQQVPIVVVVLSDSSRYLVIDGFQRLRALERLGQDTVKAVIWDLDEAEALILDRSQRSSQKLSALEQGWLLLELHSGQGLSLEELAQRFDQSPDLLTYTC